MGLGKTTQHRCIRKAFSAEESEALLHFVLLLWRALFTPFQYLFSFPACLLSPIYLVWKERHWSHRISSSWTLKLCFDIMAGWRRSHVPQSKQCEVNQMVTLTSITFCTVTYNAHAAEHTEQYCTAQAKEVTVHSLRTARLWCRKMQKTH